MKQPRAQWEHWQIPGTTRFNAHSHMSGHVGFSSSQGWENEADCLDAIESVSGSRKSVRVDWANRTRSPRRRRK